MKQFFDTTAYRYHNEHLVLLLTIVLVIVVIAITATATMCFSLFFVLLVVVMSYVSSRRLHQSLLQGGLHITREREPDLARLVEETRLRIQAEPVEVFAVRSQALNAYTFGLLSPKVVVLHSSLLQAMDRDELQFVIGHELSHVKLGHTWLNSLVGGMAGIPSTYGAAALLQLAFLGWNRACEYSADRAGLLACGNLNKSISALIKIEAGPGGHTPEQLERAVDRIEAQDDTLAGSLGELLATHPLIVRRINHLRAYAASRQYQQLSGPMQQNSTAAAASM